MSARATTLIIIPAYNERERIGGVIQKIHATHVAADVLVVDDGSGDGTPAEARRRGAMVIQHPFNMGYGAALLTGYLYAKRHRYKKIVQMDADGQHDPASLQDMIDAVDDRTDVVIGSRYLSPKPPPTGPLRKLGSRVFSFIVTNWTGVRITDPTSGYQAMNERALTELAHDGFPEDYPDADVLIILSRAGMKLREIAVVMHERSGGVSMHRGSRAAYYGCKMALTLALLPVRRRSPYRSARTAPAGIGS